MFNLQIVFLHNSDGKNETQYYLIVLNNQIHGEQTPLFTEIWNKPWTYDSNNDIPVLLL